VGKVGIAIAVALALAACHGSDATYSVGGDISFQNGTGTAVLKLNGANDIAINGDGSFKFDHKLLTDETYNVQVVDVSDRCTVQSGAGTMGKSNVTNVSISCTPQSSLNFTLTGIRSANLSGELENPPVTTSATGVGGVILKPASLQITGGVTLSGLTPVLVRIHQAPTGDPTADGSAIITLVVASDGLTAVVPPNTALDTNQLASLLAGELYFNVTTVANASGEIRGPIELQGGVAASVASLDASQVRPTPPVSTATGIGTLLADQATGRILITYITHNVANTSAAGIHTATGPASVILFTNFQTNIVAGTNLASPVAPPHLSSQNLADFANGLLYFEVDSLGNPAGEIRGNISQQ
jgi:hypothetical protein